MKESLGIYICCLHFLFSFLKRHSHYNTGVVLVVSCNYGCVYMIWVRHRVTVGRGFFFFFFLSF